MFSPDFLCCFITIHFRHHDIHQHHIYFWIVIIDDLNRFFATFCSNYIDIVSFKYGGQCKQISHIIIHHQDIFSGKDIFFHPDIFDHLSFFRRQVLMIDMQMQYRFFQQMFQVNLLLSAR